MKISEKWQMETDEENFLQKNGKHHFLLYYPYIQLLFTFAKKILQKWTNKFCFIQWIFEVNQSTNVYSNLFRDIIKNATKFITFFYSIILTFFQILQKAI